jgi:integrase
MRAHLNAVRLFLRWCEETGRITNHRDAPLRRLVKAYPPVYGKAQGFRPANRLTQAQYETLTATCDDGTDAGLRDELLIRIGVSAGMRVTELRSLTVGGIRRAPQMHWIGKANKPRSAKAGPALVDLIDRYLARYEQEIGRALTDDMPAFCPAVHSRRPGELRWGHALTTNQGIRLLLVRRSEAAGVGYMAPHDLKRTAARMMHDARTADGAHMFDLLDIADVLDHSNPKVTKDCYVGPLDTTNKDRAAALFG